MSSARGPVACRWYAAHGKGTAVIWVGGVGGGWDSPAKDVCPRLAVRLQEDGIGSLRVRFRNPTDLEEAVHDVSTAWIISNKRESSASASMGRTGSVSSTVTVPFF